MTDHTTSEQPDLLTLTEAAALLRAPVATLRYWRHLGTGPRSFRAGRHVLYRRSDLHDWIDQQQAADDPTPDQHPAGHARRAAAPAGRR
ncbi:MAG TPA: helix-turn-helix domain-containing protein [Mycobacteriales bacterium]